MTAIGIDPGLSGALAVLSGTAQTVVPFSEADYCAELLAVRGVEPIAVVERVHSMPKQGVASSFRFGDNYGWIRGVLAALAIPYELVLPQKWKREFGVTADKNTAIDVAHRLFPSVSLRRTDKCRTDDDGMAEALLMAEYCRRHFRR